MNLIELLQAYRKCKTLACRTKCGDKIFTAAYPLLWDFIIHRLKDRQVAQDVLQETMLSIAKGLRTVKGETEAAFLGWMRRIAFCRISDALRTKYADRADYLEPEVIEQAVAAGSEGGELSPGVKLDIELLLRVLREAKFPCDEILWSYMVAGMAIGEIAGMYSVSYDSARMKIRRCLEAAQSLANGM